jgi:dCTP deaminase
MFHLRAGNIQISPFDERLMNSNSYDVRLGEWAIRQKGHSLIPPVVRYNTNDGQEIMWANPTKIGPHGLYLDPGETVLCHTEEFIGGQAIITSEMKAKSTTGRYCLSVCKCAGLGDVGYISRWTMEMTNHSGFIVCIQPGEPIAQIVFHLVSEVEEQYHGRYGQGEWKPEDMLPKKKIFA